MSTKSRALFLYCNAGHTPPDAFMNRVFVQYPSWVGLAFIENGVLEWSQDIGKSTLDGFKQLRDAKKDVDMFFAFGREEDTDKTVDENDDNIQPWVLVERGEGDDATTQVLVFVDGSLDSFATNTAPEGRPFLFVGSKIQAMVQSLWSMVNKDADKFCEQMRMPHNQAAIESMVGADGSVMIMTPTNKGSMYYGSPPDGDEYPWGFVNNTLGYKEQTTDNSTKNQLKMSTADVSNMKDQAIAHLFRPNANIVVTKDLKELYIKYHGKPLSNNQMQKRQAAPLLPDKLQEAKADTRITLSIIAAAEAAKLSTSVPSVSAQVTHVTSKADIKKFVDANIIEVMSPEDMEKNEAPKNTVWDQTGWKLDDYVHGKNSSAIDKKLVEEYPNAAIDMLRDLRYAIFQLNKDLERATKPPAETKTATVTPTQTRKGRFAVNG